jgi:hypothetical protein
MPIISPMLKPHVVVVWLRDGFYVHIKLVRCWERRFFKAPTSTFFVGRGNSHWLNYWNMKCASNSHHLFFASDAICKIGLKVFRNCSVKNRLVNHSRKRYYRFGKYLSNQMKTNDKACSQSIRPLTIDTSFYVLSNYLSLIILPFDIT